MPSWILDGKELRALRLPPVARGASTQVPPGPGQELADYTAFLESHLRAATKANR